MGELLYRLKYRADRTVIPEAAASFVSEWCPEVEVLVPVPPSRERAVQPVLVIGAAIAARLGIESLPDCVRRTRDVPQLKDVFDYDERWRLLDGLHEVDRLNERGDECALRSGARPRRVRALALTRTRSRR